MYKEVLDTALVGDAYKLLKILGLAQGITKSDIQPYYYKPLKEMICEVFLSLFDGQMNTHSTDDGYYKLVMATFSIPSKFIKNNPDVEELKNLAHRLMTGGEINNQHATI